MSVVITAKRGLFLWLLAITMSVTIPLTCVVSRMYPAPPEPAELPKLCVDSGEIRDDSLARYECSLGAKIEIYPMGINSRGRSQALFKCICSVSK